MKFKIFKYFITRCPICKARYINRDNSDDTEWYDYWNHLWVNHFYSYLKYKEALGWSIGYGIAISKPYCNDYFSWWTIRDENGIIIFEWDSSLTSDQNYRKLIEALDINEIIKFELCMVLSKGK